MSLVLSRLLGAAEPAFSLGLRDLEEKSGRESVDVKLIAEVNSAVRAKCKELGLDSKDIDPKELYFALKHLAKLHDEHLAIAVQVMDGGIPQISAIKKTIEKLKFDRSAWVLKHSVLKRLLSQKAPKSVMRVLGYRSLDSMLKRENPEKVLLAAKMVESHAWHQNFAKALKKVGPTAYETRKLSIVLLDEETFDEVQRGFTRQHGSNVLSALEAGAVGILPMPSKYKPGMTIAVFAFVLEELSLLKMLSAYLKLHQVGSGFGEISLKASQRESVLTSILGHPIHWQSIVRRHSGLESPTELLEGHLSLKDILAKRAEDLLFQIEPSLLFWRGIDFVAVEAKDRKPVSLNLLDNAINCLNDLEFGERYFNNFQNSLWHELLARYLTKEQIEQAVMAELDKKVGSASERFDIKELSFV